MYIPAAAQQIADGLFTSYEQLYGKLTPERILELVSRPDAKILKLDHDSNDFGTFWFITFDILNKGRFQFYGLGNNTGTDCFQRDFKEVSVWLMSPEYKYDMEFRPDREKDQELLEHFQQIIQNSPTTNGTPQSKYGAIFSLMEELADSDSAYAYMEHCRDMDFNMDE